MLNNKKYVFGINDVMIKPIQIYINAYITN
ncbi:hypothetical protein SAMN06272738_5905 [Bacillus sp. JKS001846]|nr:hypothetical protein SAMN06272738_5905 [Bacillus sp. JKS001846]